MLLLTGANGFIGSYLAHRLVAEGYDVLATGRGPARIDTGSTGRMRYQSLDFTDPFAVHDTMQAFHPSVIVHCGAMGKPDECELKQWEAHQVNVEGTMHLALHAAESGAYFLFLSTDFVFDGETGMYSEEDALNPVNFYGRTKAEAEAAVRELAGDSAIVRTVLVYGAPQSGRSNLLSIVSEKLSAGQTYSVVDDQYRTPTYVGDLVNGMTEMVNRRVQGVYHLSGREMMTPFEMAVTAARIQGFDPSGIQRVTTGELKHPARRPVRTGLSIKKAENEWGYKPAGFADGVRAMFSATPL